MLSELFLHTVSDPSTLWGYFLCLLTSLLLGGLIAFSFSYRHKVSKSFQLSLLMLPGIVQTIILLVNGNVGTGIAVAGAFSLVRFRSIPGTAREITAIFLAMATGLATAMGSLGLALLFVFIMCLVLWLLTLVDGKQSSASLCELKITVPESLNYIHAFDEVFEQYTSECRLLSAKTTNMGSLYKLQYQLVLKNPQKEQEFINALRCRNGNLEIMIGVAATTSEELL